MTPAKQHALEQGLNGVARKVLDVVPIEEAWQISQIMAELRRTGHQNDIRVVTGCLSSLRDQGLIKEPQRGSFVRVVPRTRLAAVPSPAEANTVEPPMAEPSKTAPTKSIDPLDRLASMAKTLSGLSNQLKALGQEMEVVALEVEERAQQNATENAKLRQLKELLREI